MRENPNPADTESAYKGDLAWRQSGAVAQIAEEQVGVGVVCAAIEKF